MVRAGYKKIRRKSPPDLSLKQKLYEVVNML